MGRWVPQSNLALEAEHRDRLLARLEYLESGSVRQINKKYDRNDAEITVGTADIENTTSLGSPSVTFDIPDLNCWLYFYAELRVRTNLVSAQPRLFLLSTTNGNADAPAGSAVTAQGGPNYRTMGSWTLPVAGTNYNVCTATNNLSAPPNPGNGSLMVVRPAAAGTHTYTLTYGKGFSGAGTVAFANRRLWAYMVG